MKKKDEGEEDERLSNRIIKQSRKNIINKREDLQH